jgi:ribosomal protein S27AE
MLSIAAAALPAATVCAGQEQARTDEQQQPETQNGGQRDQDKPQPADETPADDSSSIAAEDPSKITHKDADGLDYRECPQCGFNMYRQDRTWTCENCGYSYTE